MSLPTLRLVALIPLLGMDFALCVSETLESGTLSKCYLCDGEIKVHISVAQERAVEVLWCNIRLIVVLMRVGILNASGDIKG